MSSFNEIEVYPKAFAASVVLDSNGDVDYCKNALRTGCTKMADISNMPVTEVITMTLPAGWSYDDMKEFDK